MSIYNSLQSNVGQLVGTGQMVGFEVPFTEVEVGMPPVPITEMHFDNDPLAIAGTALIAGGAILGYRHRKESIDRLQKQFPAGRDNTEVASRPIRRERLRSLVGLIALTAGLSGAALHQAGPHTEEGVNNIDSLAVVVDMGYESRAVDVDSDDGLISRYVASVNGLTLDQYALSSLEGIEVTYIAAGASPDSMGVITEGTKEEKATVISNFDNYRSPAQFGTEASGGGDITEALGIAKGLNPDMTIVLAGDLTGDEQASILDDEELPQNNNVKVIALGRNGSEVDLLGGTADAPINEAYNDLVVGPEDSYTATSMDELEDVIDEIVDGQIKTDVRTEVNMFKKMYLSALLAGGALFGYQILQDSRRRNKPVNGNK